MKEERIFLHTRQSFVAYLSIPPRHPWSWSSQLPSNVNISPAWHSPWRSRYANRIRC